MANTVTQGVSLSECPHNWQNDPKYVYVGPPTKGLKPNPRTIALPMQVGESREQWMERYANALLVAMEEDADYRRFLTAHHGCQLVCTCASHHLCHSQVLAWAIDLCVEREAVTGTVEGMVSTIQWKEAMQTLDEQYREMHSKQDRLVREAAEEYRVERTIFPPDPDDAEDMKHMFKQLKLVLKGGTQVSNHAAM